MERRWLLIGMLASGMAAAACFLALILQPAAICSASSPPDGTEATTHCDRAPDPLELFLVGTMLAALVSGIVTSFALILSHARGTPGRQTALRIGAAVLGAVILFPSGWTAVTWIGSLPNVGFEHIGADGAISCGGSDAYPYGQAPPPARVCMLPVQLVSAALLLVAGLLLISYCPWPRRASLPTSALLVLVAIGAIYADNWFGGHPRAQLDASDLILVELLIAALTLLGSREGRRAALTGA